MNAYQLGLRIVRDLGLNERVRKKALDQEAIEKVGSDLMACFLAKGYPAALEDARERLRTALMAIAH